MTVRYFKDSAELVSPPTIFTFPVGSPPQLTVESDDPLDSGTYRIEITNSLDFNSMSVVTNVEVIVHISCTNGEVTILDDYIPGDDSFEYIIGHTVSY